MLDVVCSAEALVVRHFWIFADTSNVCYNEQKSRRYCRDESNMEVKEVKVR